MNSNINGLILSVAFVCFVVLFGFLLRNFTRISAEAVRKFIHIGVSNWVFILVYCFDNIYYAAAGPAVFIIVNTIFVYSGMGVYLGMGDRKRDNGLIYFPISLLILVLMLYKGILTESDVITGVLIMGYGDGLAALIGSKWGRHKYSVMNCTKSWEGTVVMAVVSFIIAVLSGHGPAGAALIALIAAFFEAVTPLGLDNVTVPLISALAGAML